MKKEITYTTVFGKKFTDFDRAIQSELAVFEENTRVFDFDGRDITEGFYNSMREEATEKSPLFEVWNKGLMDTISMIQFKNGGIYQAFVNCEYIHNMDESKYLFEREEAFVMYNADFIYNVDFFEDISLVKVMNECIRSFISLEELRRHISIIMDEIHNIKIAVTNVTDRDLSDFR